MGIDHTDLMSEVWKSGEKLTRMNHLMELVKGLGSALDQHLVQTLLRVKRRTTRSYIMDVDR